MGAKMVVPGADGGEIFVEVLGDSGFEKPGEDSLLESEEEALDASVKDERFDLRLASLLAVLA